MKRLSALPLLAETAAAQWGMFTTGQAERLGISRLQVSRLNKSRAIERFAFGVYKDTAVPGTALDSLRATWLSLETDRFVEERLLNPKSGFVVTGLAATQIHEIGDWYVDEYEFSFPERKQTQRSNLKFRCRALSESSVTVVGGIPTTTIEQTIADLLEQREDFSNVAGAFSQAVREGKIHEDKLISILEPVAKKLGFKEGEGKAVLAKLQESAHIDQVSLAKMMANISPTIATASALFASLNVNPQGLKEMNTTLGELSTAFQKMNPQGITQIAQLTELLRSAELYGTNWKETVEKLKHGL